MDRKQTTCAFCFLERAPSARRDIGRTAMSRSTPPLLFRCTCRPVWHTGPDCPDSIALTVTHFQIALLYAIKHDRSNARSAGVVSPRNSLRLSLPRSHHLREGRIHIWRQQVLSAREQRFRWEGTSTRTRNRAGAEDTRRDPRLRRTAASARRRRRHQ